MRKDLKGLEKTKKLLPKELSNRLKTPLNEAMKFVRLKEWLSGITSKEHI
jgi:hypothetical protein